MRSHAIDNAKAMELILRCTRHDKRALSELHDLLAKRIYAFAFNRLRNEVDAETVVVDTLYEVWRSAAQFRGESLVTTWILGIARYKAMQLRERSGPEHEDIEDYADDLVSDVEDGETALSRWQVSQQVRRCLEQLTPQHRECVQLVYFEGLGLADVARLQDVPENTVKTRLFHARKNVRSCVEQVGISSAG
jgi:RNA polymerase sigma-70 factor (ECF subfamily)